MSVIKAVWDFIQYELLGMRWLDRLIGAGLSAFGLDLNNRLAASARFFIYDVIKITVLLCALIFLISFIQSYFPPERARRILKRVRGVRANIAAALLGTVTPFCSCSSIPLFMGFTSVGLPLGVTFSFLISSPMVDLGSLILLTGIFGVRVAALYVLVGLVIAVAGGTLIEKLNMDNQIEPAILQAPGALTQAPELKRRDRLLYAKEQTLSTLRRVFFYILAGVGVGALIHNWVPESWVSAVLGNGNPLGVILSTAIGVPMYADIFGVIPVAQALFMKGARLGSVLSFMMAVTALSLPSMILLRRAVKPKLLILFAAIVTAGIIAVGYLFNALAPFII